jgi:hypothetical protein
MLNHVTRQCVVLQSGKLAVKADNFYAPVGRRVTSFAVAEKACRAALVGLPVGTFQVARG